MFAAVTSLAATAAFTARALGHDWFQDGQASYYANHWIGHRTTSGARFDQNKLTCAHATLPLGTRLLVTADDTGDSVVVTVNDRQPDHGDRIIDLSRAAASRLHMLGAGITEVTITKAMPADLNAVDAEQSEEVAEAPDDAAPADDVADAAPRHVSRARHGRPRTHHARR